MSPERSGAYVYALLLVLSLLCSCKEPVKEPAVAGSFYPSDRAELKTVVDGFLSRVEHESPGGDLMALIAPHAGYLFSGQVAAYAYDHLHERDVHTVIIIGPSHHVAFQGVSVYKDGLMRTPLGDIRINKRIAENLINEDNDVIDFPEAFSKEHSIEVQLPFLQRTLGNVNIVPLLVGTPTMKSYSYLTDRITRLMRKDRGIIIVASTDLSHYHDYDTAMQMDEKITDAIKRMSLEDVERLVRTGEAEMCGAYPVIYSMAIIRGLGATNGVLYKYANSGDVTGDRGRVVGYAALGLYRTPLSDRQRDRLLKLARNAIETFVQKKQIPDTKVKDSRLMANGATFVTINRKGRLRGCIGNIQPTMPLYESVVSNSVAACSRDGRFTPVTKLELGDIEVEVTVLSPLEPLKDTENISIGKHGLFLVKGNYSGILLPQVATEFGWDRSTFLEQVSLKAGLDREAWKSADIYRFTADIIGEHQRAPR